MSTEPQHNTPVSAELVALPQCPFPCGWSGLHKIAVQDAAYLAKVQWPEDEEGVSVPRATAMRSMDYLIQVCRTMLNAAPVAAQPDLTQQTLDDVKAGIPARDAEIEALRNELETLQAQMKNPVVVHSNMCRGIIAPITFDMLAHVLGDEAKQEWLASQAQQPVSGADGLPIELRGIAEAIGNGGGFWRSCSGCHESNEGMATGPFSETLKCHLGVGCSECGGIGAIWDTTDYDAMADFMAAEYQQRTENTEPVGQGQLRDAAQMIESSGNSGELPRLPLNDPAAAYRVLHDYGQSCAHAALALSHPDTATYQQAKAWKAVCAALDFVNPRWAEEDGTGEECAVKAIVSLAQQDADKVDTWRSDDVDLHAALTVELYKHPQTRAVIGREALVLRCVRAAIDAARKEPDQ